MSPFQKKPGGASLYQELKDLVASHGGPDMDSDGDMQADTDMDNDGPAPAGKDGAALVVQVGPKDSAAQSHTCPMCGQPMP